METTNNTLTVLFTNKNTYENIKTITTFTKNAPINKNW